MNKQIVEVKKGIIQITTYDERWYAKEIRKKKTGLPEVEFYPSVTWISSYYPKGIGYMKWLASKGWDEAELAKEEAGGKGYKVHIGANALLNGNEVAMKDAFPTEYGAEPEALRPDEYECLMALVDWVSSLENFEVVATEITAFNEEHLYAGTVDLICRINGQYWIIDLKTSAYIWPSHEIQLSAYSHLDLDLKEIGIGEKEWKARKLAILQLGYNRNKVGWKFTEIKDQIDLFLAAKMMWQKECGGIEPKQKDYPLTLKIKNENNNKKTNRRR